MSPEDAAAQKRPRLAIQFGLRRERGPPRLLRRVCKCVRVRCAARRHAAQGETRREGPQGEERTCPEAVCLVHFEHGADALVEHHRAHLVVPAQGRAPLPAEGLGHLQMQDGERMSMFCEERALPHAGPASSSAAARAADGAQDTGHSGHSGSTQLVPPSSRPPGLPRGATAAPPRPRSGPLCRRQAHHVRRARSGVRRQQLGNGP